MIKKRIKQFYRLLHINFVLARHGLDKLILSLHLFAPLRFLIYLNPWNWFRPHDYQRGVAFRKALEELGPIFIKFGQALSTRRDLIPADIADELARLQDNVAPFPSLVAKKIVESTLERTLPDLFAEFSMEPLASASVAQVHAATLHTGEQVIVKIIRPNIEKIIARDISVLYMLAELAERYLKDGPRLKPIAVVAEFEKTLYDELDLIREAANASQLRRNFINSSLLTVPAVHWEYTRSNIMVQERVYGIPISNIEELRANKVNVQVLAEMGVEIFFTQVFRDSFFHADMHPGNIFVNMDDPNKPRYVCVDFGIMGTLDQNDKRYLAENFHAFFNRDYQRVAELHIESGWVPYNTRIPDFEAAIRSVCEPIFERPLSEISVATMLLRLFQTGRRFDMEIQPQLVLLQKTLFAIEGLGRQLYPQLDLWATAKPFLEDYLRKQMGPRAFLKKLMNYAPYWLEKLPDLPDRLDSVLRLTHQHLEHNQFLQQHAAKPRKKHKQRRGFILGVACCFTLFGGALFLRPELAPTLPQTYATGILAAGLLTLLLSYLLQGES